MIKTKGLKAAVTSGMLVLALVAGGCGATQEASAGLVHDAETQESEAKSGGWTDADVTSGLTAEEQQLFDKAVKAAGREDLKPAAVVATQVVAGLNYCVLCQDTSAHSWCFAVIYRDLNSNATLTGTAPLDLNALQTSDASGEKMTGAWEVSKPGEAQTLPAEASKAFSNATAEYVGVGFTPVALLSTQVVAGMNYRYLCIGETMSAEPVMGLYVVTVYEDLDQNAEITDVARLDLNAYMNMVSAG